MQKLIKFRTEFEYMRFLLHRNKRFLMLLFIGYFVSNPLLLIISEGISLPSDIAFLFGIGFNACLLLFSVYIVSNLMFAYQKSKKGLDVFHALPISRISLYLTTFLTGVILIFLPFFACAILSTSLNVVMFAQPVSIFTDVFRLYTRLVPIILVIYSVNIFAQLNTGTIFDGVLYSLILIFLPLLMLLVFVLYGGTFILGFSGNVSSAVILLSSPLSDFVGQIISFFTSYEMDSFSSYTLYWYSIVIFIAFANMFIYKSMKTETAGQPFTNKVFFPIVSVITTVVFHVLFLTIFVQFNSSFEPFALNTYFIPLLISMIIFAIMTSIAKRSFDYLFSSLIKYFVIGSLAFIAIFSIDQANYFGYFYTVPKNATSATLSFYDVFETYTTSKQNSYSSYVEVEFDLASMHQITEFHQLILDSYALVDYEADRHYDLIHLTEYSSASFEQFSTPSSVEHVVFSYYDGNSLIKEVSYIIPTVMLKEIAKYEYTTNTFNHLYHNILRSDVAHRDIQSAFIYGPLGNPNNSNLLDVDDTFIEEFTQVYKQDFLSLDTYGPFDTNYEYLGYIEFFYTNTFEESTFRISNNFASYTDLYFDSTFPLDSRYVNTLSFLEDNNIELVESKANGHGLLIYPNTADPYNHSFYTPYIGGLGLDGPIDSTLLSPEQVDLITPYLIPKGVSDTQTYVVQLNEDPVEYAPESYIINPLYFDTVTEIIKNNTVESYNYFDDALYDFFSLNNTVESYNYFDDALYDFFSLNDDEYYPYYDLY